MTTTYGTGYAYSFGAVANVDQQLDLNRKRKCYNIIKIKSLKQSQIKISKKQRKKKISELPLEEMKCKMLLIITVKNQSIINNIYIKIESPWQVVLIKNDINIYIYINSL